MIDWETLENMSLSELYKLYESAEGVDISVIEEHIRKRNAQHIADSFQEENLTSQEINKKKLENGFLILAHL